MSQIQRPSNPLPSKPPPGWNGAFLRKIAPAVIIAICGTVVTFGLMRGNFGSETEPITKNHTGDTIVTTISDTFLEQLPTRDFVAVDTAAANDNNPNNVLKEVSTFKLDTIRNRTIIIKQNDTNQRIKLPSKVPAVKPTTAKNRPGNE